MNCFIFILSSFLFSNSFAEEILSFEESNCTPAAIYEFPSDGLTRDQRKAGWITLHVLLAAYCFIALSIVCDEYFVPAIETLVKKLQLQEDVAGASFMAITSASPELFINSVGTFITQGDIGVGTVVGSNVFNNLAIPACCGLFARTKIKFDYWAISRDGFMYAISVTLLILTLYDGKVQWYEALIFVLTYAFYIIVMYYNKDILKKIKKYYTQTDEVHPTELEKLNLECPASTTKDSRNPDDKNKIIVTVNAIWKGITCPIIFLLRYTMPNCKANPNVYPLTLLMCVFVIGSISYFLAWIITIIGDTIGIPDSVMGLSFLAIGSSMPEIVTCFIVSRKGQGVMAISSALGANTFEILLCLGLPWLIKSCFNPKLQNSHWITINSSGLAYNATFLLSSLLILYITLLCNRFRMDLKVGLICLIIYGTFLIIGTLIELNVFLFVNLPTCA